MDLDNLEWIVKSGILLPDRDTSVYTKSHGYGLKHCDTASAADPPTQYWHEHQDKPEHLALLLLIQKSLILGQKTIARFFSLTLCNLLVYRE